MGNTSDRAFAKLEELDQSRLPMHNGLVVKLGADVLVEQRFLYAQGNHIEELAMHYLNTHPSEVPDGAHVVFFANWSPCTACLNGLRKPIGVILNKKPNCRFRFRFKHYYSRDEWARLGRTVDTKNYRGLTLFGTERIARTFYDDFQRHFGDFAEKVHDGQRFVSPRVAFIQDHDHSRRPVPATAASTST